MEKKASLLKVENYRYTRYRKSYHGACISLRTSPESLCFSRITIDIAKYPSVAELLDCEFGVTEDEVIGIILSKSIHGRDRNGRYMVVQFDRHNKRPKRHRPHHDLIPYIEKYLANPEGVYDNSHIKDEWECAGCGKRGVKDQWPWSKNYMFDTEYISHCPVCKPDEVAKDSCDLLDVKAISSKALGKDVTSKIIHCWSHNKPRVMCSGKKIPMECGNGYRGSIIML